MKNVLVVLAAAGTGVLGEASVLSRLFVLWACFSLVASGVYLFNDVLDVPLDRLDPRKASRPVAAGLLSPRSALVASATCTSIGFAAATVLDPATGFVVLLYVLTSVLYSWRLKDVPVLEVLLVASGFVFRAIAGALVVAAPLTGWFLPLVATVAAFVVLVKRSGEAREGVSRRPVLAAYGEHGLRASRRVALFVALVLYAGWVSASPLLPSLTSFVFLASSLWRVDASVASGRASAPDELVFRDPLLCVLAIGWFGCFLLAVG